MTIVDILKAFIVGICVTIPIGPIAVLVIQNTIAKGRKPGFVTSLGGTTVDSTWALVSVFCLGLAEALIDKYNTEIFVVGGAVLIVMGVMMAMSNPFRKLDRQFKLLERREKVSPKDYFKAVLVGFCNPGAIFVMFGLFAGFGINVSSSDGWRIIFVILAIACGSMTYWLTFTYIVSRLRKSINLKAILWVNRLSGAAIVAFGVYFLVRALLKIL